MLRPYYAFEELAILFHDIVYIPGSQLNEAQSIDMMDHTLNQYPQLRDAFSGADIDKAADIIMDTKYPHVPKSEFSRYVVDMDMLGFSSFYSTFLTTNNKIEREFKGVKNFKTGRKGFLTTLLDGRIPFYFSKEVQKIKIPLSQKERQKVSLDEKARTNIRKLIEGHY